MKNLKNVLENLANMSDSIFMISYSTYKYKKPAFDVLFDDLNADGINNIYNDLYFLGKLKLNELTDFDDNNYSLLTDINIKSIIKNIDIILETKSINLNTLPGFIFNHQNGLTEIKIPKDIAFKFIDSINTNNIIDINNIKMMYQKCRIKINNKINIDCLLTKDTNTKYNESLYKYNVYKTNKSDIYTISENPDDIPIFSLLSNEKIESKEIYMLSDNPFHYDNPFINEYNPYIKALIMQIDILLISDEMVSIEDYMNNK